MKNPSKAGKYDPQAQKNFPMRRFTECSIISINMKKNFQRLLS